MRMNVLTVKTVDDLTLYFRAQSKEKDVNGLPEVDNVERLRAVPAAEISQYDVEMMEDTAIRGH